MKRTFCLFLLVFSLPETNNWGFYSHSLINRMAVYSLPPEMFGFFKKNIEYITEKAVNPDRRRYAVQGEAPRHYIDLDNYSDSVRTVLPTLFWNEAVELLGEKELMENGIVPWQVQKMKFQLTEAFRKRSASDIVRIATDLGHYIADSNVPLHTTKNYNGQLTNQDGIHGFWESRLPELFAKDYSLFIGKAEYESNIAGRSWEAVLNAHSALDTVLKFEKKLSNEFPVDKKYTVDERNGLTLRNYSREFSDKYHKLLENQVERQMEASIKMIADVWFTAWADAGQPNLEDIPKYTPDPEEEKAMIKAWFQKLLNVRREADS